MKIFVLEDDDDVMVEIEAALQALGQVFITREKDGEDALNTLLQNHFDCMILDRMVPKIDGLTVLRELRDRKIETPALVLSLLSSLDHRIAGLDTGADDYLTKPFEAEELAARVRALLRRADMRGAERLYQLGPLKLLRWAAEPKATWGDRDLELTGKTFDLLLCLARHHPHTVPRSIMFREVWPHNVGLDPADSASINLMDVTVARLREKLQDKLNITDPILAVRKVGLRLNLPFLDTVSIKPKQPAAPQD